MATRSKSVKSKPPATAAGASRPAKPAKPAKGGAKPKAQARSAAAPITVLVQGNALTLEELAAAGLNAGLAIDIDALLAADPAKRAALQELLDLLGAGSLIAISKTWGP